MRQAVIQGKFKHSQNKEMDSFKWKSADNAEIINFRQFLLVKMSVPPCLYTTLFSNYSAQNCILEHPPGILPNYAMRN